MSDEGRGDTPWFRARVWHEVLEIRYSGDIDGRAVAESLERIKTVVGVGRIAFGLVDTLEVAHIKGDIHPPSQQVLAYFKSTGMRELLLVMSNPIVRMIVRATSLVTKMPTRGFDDMKAAQAYLRQHDLVPPG